jgi:2,3-dihydroxyphenylpropionate 1,2-dioxygenase
MSAILECLSHTPLHGYFDPQPEVVAEVAKMSAAARERVRQFDPEQ